MHESPAIERVDPATIDDATLAAFNDHLNRARLESDPTLPARPVAELEVILRAPPETQRPLWWIVRHDGMVIGHVYLELDDGNTSNLHLGEVDVGVDADWRRQGIGTRLFELARAAAQQHGRSLLFLTTSSRLPSGDAFASHLGAELGLTDIESRLDLNEVDRRLMTDWSEIGSRLDGAYALVWWDGPIPEADLDEVVALRH
ncbi:MAG: GNAT family N-acetyltransferase, partial [Acidimicrobiia bacterium]|nr:GNAT family N-acetyltransferase [Acidimicrobiia bacterium]